MPRKFRNCERNILCPQKDSVVYYCWKSDRIRELSRIVAAATAWPAAAALYCQTDNLPADFRLPQNEHRGHVPPQNWEVYRIMHCTHLIAPDTWYVGASDRRLAKFENLFPIPRGVSYNSYVILDEKTALLDTADASVAGQFLENVAHALNGRKLDYLIVDHMEPDHAATIAEVLLRWPEAQIVCNAKTVPMLKAYFPADTGKVESALLVKEGRCAGSGHP